MTENQLLVRPENEAAPREATPAWECCVCMTDGTTTGQLSLACKHNVCLSCYTGMLNVAPSYMKYRIPCPMCRRGIRNTDELPPEATADLNNKIRTCLQINSRLTQLQQEVSNTTGSLRRAMETLKESAELWGVWEQTKASYERQKAQPQLAPAPVFVPAPAPAPVPVPVAAQRAAAPAQDRFWCPGCREMKTNVRHRRIGNTTRRLKRCDDCARS
jgi:hypothetical protein